MSSVGSSSVEASAHHEVSRNVVAYLHDEESCRIVEQVLNERLWPIDHIYMGGAEDAAKYLGEHEHPDLLIVDLSEARNPAAQVQLLTKLRSKDTRIVGVGEINDIELYRQLTADGLVDYLVKPLLAEAVSRSLDAEHGSAAVPGNEAKESRLVAVVGGRGGVGASTVAVSTAWLMGHDFAKLTALVDLDLHFGTCALAMDLLPGRGLREALEHPERIDSLFISRAMVRQSDNLHILGGEEALNERAHIDNHGLDLLIVELNQNFDYVVMDVPRAFAISHPHILSSADKIVIVSDLSLPGVRDTLRLLTFAKEAAPDAKLKVLVNMMGRTKHDVLPLAEFERGIVSKVDYQVPYDDRSIAAANKQGKAATALSKRTPLSKALRTLCEDLMEIVPAKRKSIFSRRKSA